MQISMHHISACERQFEHQSYYKQNFKFLAVLEPIFLIPQICPKSAVNWVLYVYRPASVFLLYLDLTSGLCRAVFPMYLVSPIGLPAY